ncbi:MAG TPA: hypothetical protein VNL69_00915 [Bacteroidota bacterium]|nr:hypothetical protein [Bacteroidota bacterium]
MRETRRLVQLIALEAILLFSATLTHAQPENALGPFVSVQGGLFQPSSGVFAKSYKDAYRGGFGFDLGSLLSEMIVTFGWVTRRVFPPVPSDEEERRVWGGWRICRYCVLERN